MNYTRKMLHPGDALAAVSVILVCIITHQWTTDADKWSLGTWRIINACWLGATLISCAMETFWAKYEPASITYNLMMLVFTFYSILVVATASSNFTFVVNILLCTQCYFALLGGLGYIGYRVHYFRGGKFKK
jgi:ABC-type thiamin/hydroxymethylpyrimidine transport system permease subunit